MLRVSTTEESAQNNRTKMELQLETAQQVHFRSVIKPQALWSSLKQMEDSDGVRAGRAQSESSSSKYSSALLWVRVTSGTREINS